MSGPAMWSLVLLGQALGQEPSALSLLQVGVRIDKRFSKDPYEKIVHKWQKDLEDASSGASVGSKMVQQWSSHGDGEETLPREAATRSNTSHKHKHSEHRHEDEPADDDIVKKNHEKAKGYEDHDSTFTLAKAQALDAALADPADSIAHQDPPNHEDAQEPASSVDAVDAEAEALQAGSPATDGKPSQALDVLPLGGAEQEALVAAMGKLNQGGYQKIVKLRNTTLMIAFIKLVAVSNGGLVTDEASLRGFAPFHSGEQGIQNYNRLVKGLKEASWTTVGDSNSDATLDQEGYERLAQAKDTPKMAEFIRRVIAMYGGRLVDENVLSWYAKYHSGEKARQKFKQLVIQLRKCSWVSGMRRRAA